MVNYNLIKLVYFIPKNNKYYINFDLTVIMTNIVARRETSSSYIAFAWIAMANTAARGIT